MSEPSAARDVFLRGMVLFGMGVWLSTEGLGAMHLIGRTPLLVFWIVFIVIVLKLAPRLKWPWVSRDPVVLLCTAGIVVIIAVTGLTAWLSPPNSADAMAYHMPRVVYWAQRGSVAFFPTPYFNQIMLQPMAEYTMLQTFVLTGGDRFINFIQLLGSLGSIVAVSSIAREFGAGPRGQAFAALFCATLPSGILAASGAKNDYFLAMWLSLAVYFALRFAGMKLLKDALFLGAALGLALLTKATAYLFAPFVLAVILFRQRSRLLLFAIAIAVMINAPQYLRNYQLSGSVMGFDSAQGDGYFRWRNERFGWQPTLSNVLRNLSDQMGARSSRWNEGIYHAVAALHKDLGIGVNDPATTWRESTFSAPINANHEANAPNRWHLLFVFLASCLVFWRRDRRRVLYALALVCAFVAFCGYLKWQPFFSRLLLPLFVLASPLAAVIDEIKPGRFVLAAVCVFLLDIARPAVLENWVRPLKGPHSVLRVPREEQYFADMSQWNNRESYVAAVNAAVALNCDAFGIDISKLTLEYPFQALLRQRSVGVRFVHTGVNNVSIGYRSPHDPIPCAVLCLDCAGDSDRLSLYSGFPVSRSFGKFVLFEGADGTK